MTVPNCPVHKEPMRSGKSGAFFCPKKMPDGSWCAQKIAPPKEPETAAAALATAGSSDAALAAAALLFAAQVWGPVDATMHDEVIATAVRAYIALKAVQS